MQYNVEYVCDLSLLIPFHLNLDLIVHCFEFDKANARLRIVSERVDFIDNVVISVSVIPMNHLLILPYLMYNFHFHWWYILIQVGPPHLEFLKSKDKRTWNAKDVADSVLSDKSALVIYLSHSYSNGIYLLVCKTYSWISTINLNFMLIWCRNDVPLKSFSFIWAWLLELLQRVTSSQRLAESSILDAQSSEVRFCVQILSNMQ